MRTLILLLILAGVAAVAVATKPCTADDCNYGKRCYTDSQCECGFACLRSDTFGNRRCLLPD